MLRKIDNIWQKFRLDDLNAADVFHL